MTASSLAHLPTADPAREAVAPKPLATTTTGSLRYDCQPRSRGMITLAVTISAGVHAGILPGFGQAKKKPLPTKTETVNVIRLVIRELQELEESEAAPTDEAAGPSDVSVPMQQDFPQIPQPSDFVQQIDFATLVERPHFSQMKLLAIPKTFRSGSGKIVQNIGAIFNLSDVDRIPETVFQPPPSFPASMTRDGLSDPVVVEFVVDTQGRAINAVVVESLYSGFEDAAIVGVQRWKFPPGIRGGHKVNSRMRVPISLTLADQK